ncbi:uncharacterized protein B0H18DRAFT_1037800 [Fomitopsis serialis]|uniref:uncharacterized protein n=1 Tax=Fomitopsis serialis TaxID=139415 RepID=UPI002008CA3F|nr:uncharacterized protein B0H18DRAFT_1037800 [Neoantrodia serialis]KAH9916632.1 hypothetical protein B0H18DRAFT_1037800 [Neoantrodia serialis]
MASTITASQVVANHCINAAITLYFYERVLTIGQEIGLVWRRASRSLFMLALYGSMHVFTMVYLLLEIVLWSISVLRVYAINGRNKWTPLATMALSLVPVATNIVSSADTTMSTTTYLRYTVTRVCVIAADSLVLLETWRNTYDLNKLARGLTMKPSITCYLINAVYYSVLLTVNIVATVACAINPVLEIANFCFVFNTILLSRFFLNLREASFLPEPGSTLSTLSQTGLHVADALRVLGGSLTDHMASSEDVLDHTGESMRDVDEEGEYPEEITERPAHLSSLDQQDSIDTAVTATDLPISRETKLHWCTLMHAEL